MADIYRPKKASQALRALRESKEIEIPNNKVFDFMRYCELATPRCKFHVKVNEHNEGYSLVTGFDGDEKTPGDDAAQKAFEFLKNKRIDELSAYVSKKTWDAISKTRINKLLELVVNYNSFRNGRYDKKTYRELFDVLEKNYKIKVPEKYFCVRGTHIIVTEQNVLDFFTDKQKFT